MNSVTQTEDNTITASMQRIRALFAKHLATGRLLNAPAYCHEGKTPRATPTLDKQQIKAIRKDLATTGTRQVAVKHGISDTLCYRIKNRKGRFK